MEWYDLEKKIKAKINKYSNEKRKFILGRVFVFLISALMLFILIDILHFKYAYIFIPFSLFGLWINWAAYKWTGNKK